MDNLKQFKLQDSSKVKGGYKVVTSTGLELGQGYAKGKKFAYYVDGFFMGYVYL